jgi:very-short-patch-repair endonuclease
MRQQSAMPDRIVAGIATRQHGVITFRQLVAAGFSPSGVVHRARAGRLHRIHRGVYAVGHPRLSNEGRWTAAVLACGEGAVLSHRSAAALWGLLRASDGPVDVTTPSTAGRRNRRGIRVYRSSSLTSGTTTIRGNIAVTTPQRTLADLRRVVAVQLWRSAARRAEVLGLGARAADGGPAPTRSELEDRFLRLCRRHRLPLPEVNVRVGPFLVDFLWRDRLLIVEADGYRYHRGRQAFESDRARDLELRRLGYDVIRLTFRQVVDEPAAVSCTLRALLFASDGA